MLPDSLLDFLAVVKQQSGKTPQWRQKKKVVTEGVAEYYTIKKHIFDFLFYLWNQTQFLKKVFQVLKK